MSGLVDKGLVAQIWDVHGKWQELTLLATNCNFLRSVDDEKTIGGQGSFLRAKGGRRTTLGMDAMKQWPEQRITGQGMVEALCKVG
jgi:hypothetical protein